MKSQPLDVLDSVGIQEAGAIKRNMKSYAGGI
jgi:hypothetical protein